MPLKNPRPGDSRTLLPGDPTFASCAWVSHDTGDKTPIALRVTPNGKALVPVCRMCLIQPVTSGRQISLLSFRRGSTP